MWMRYSLTSPRVLNSDFVGVISLVVFFCVCLHVHLENVVKKVLVSM